MQENVLERVLSVPRSSIETVNRVDTQLLMFIAKAAASGLMPPWLPVGTWQEQSG